MKVWLVQIEWAFEYEHGTEEFIFADKIEAQKAFNERKEKEKKSSWIADYDTAVDEEGNPLDDSLVIETDDDEKFEAFIQGHESPIHTYITLKEMEVK